VLAIQAPTAGYVNYADAWQWKIAQIADSGGGGLNSRLDFLSTVKGIKTDTPVLSFSSTGQVSFSPSEAVVFRVTAAGNMLFGTTTETASAGLIQLPSTTGAANGIYLGSTYANLYQSAAATVKTDGNFTVQQTLTVNGGTLATGAATGLSLSPAGGGASVVIDYVASTVNYIELISAAAGTPALVTFGAGGSSANIDIAITPKGTGVLKFGTYSAKGAEAFDGFISIKDSGGTARKVMTCA
jgi:hypothetical protein